MPRRYKVLLALLGAVVCLWFVRQAMRSRGVFETKYQGYSFVQWQEILKTGSEPQRQQARAALVVMCSNNLPELIAAMKIDPLSAQGFQRRLRWLPVWLQVKLIMNPIAQRRLDRYATAHGALSLLGSDAAFAVPEVEKLTRSTNSSIAMLALLTLPRLGTNGFACFLCALEDSQLPRRLQALQSLQWAQVDLETNAFTEAIPALRRSIQSTNDAVVVAAAQCLGYMQSGADVAVPALLAVLPRVPALGREDVLSALGEFGPSARAAVPALMSACNDTSEGNREAATNALLKIAPEVLTNGPVASPPR